MINDWYKNPTLRYTSHTQSYFFYLNIENILKISNKISIVVVKNVYIQNKSKNGHLDFLEFG